MNENQPPPPPESPSGSTDGAGQRVDDGQARIFPCTGCGADLEFHIGAQKLKCPYCSAEVELEFDEDSDVAEQDFHDMLTKLAELREQGRRDERGAKEIRCDSCGANVVFTGTLTSSECPYCGSPIQLENVHDAEHRVPVDGVLPFLIERDNARENLKAWVKSRWFAPNEFLRRGVNGKFNGVYLPYWTYDSLTFNVWSGQRGEHYYVTVGTGKNKSRQRRTRWYPASGRFQRFFDDVLVVAARGLPPKIMRALEPWPLNHCKPFTPQFLAGHFARTYDVELHAGFAQAKQRIDAAIDADVRSRIGGDEQRVSTITTRHNAITFKHLLLPVWLLAYRYKGKSYQVAVNAGTGEVQGERPYSWVKITLTLLGVLATIAAITLLIASS